MLVSKYPIGTKPFHASFKKRFVIRWSRTISWTKHFVTLQQIGVRLTTIIGSAVGITIEIFQSAHISPISKVLVKRLANRPANIGARLFSSCECIPFRKPFKVRLYHVEKVCRNLENWTVIVRMDNWREEFIEDPCWFLIISCQSTISRHHLRGLEAKCTFL